VLGIGDKAILFVKDKNAFVVFYIGINGKETCGAVIVITRKGFPHGCHRMYQMGNWVGF
jgi:hypothetical protein